MGFSPIKVTMQDLDLPLGYPSKVQRAICTGVSPILLPPDTEGRGEMDRDHAGLVVHEKSCIKAGCFTRPLDTGAAGRS
jgi:hypothetical protein